jgi:serine/threonine protein kinase
MSHSRLARLELATPSHRAPVPSVFLASGRLCLSDEDIAALLGSNPGPGPNRPVETHLARCADCRDLVRIACLSIDGHRVPGRKRPSFCAVFEPGCIVAGRYCIKQLIGRGGMGEVYDAFDLLLREAVALKAVRATCCDDPGAIDRLVTELRLGRKVRHPNVCRLYDLGYHTGDEERESRVYFFTMQLLDGDTLGQRLRNAGPLPLAEAVGVGREMLRGLAAFHEAGIVHRDVKCDNVMLHWENALPRVTLIDFGLARRARTTSVAAAPDPSGASGSLAYMAPEQALGHRIGPAADVFSFGVVLFEALTGRLPFEGVERPSLTYLTRQRELRLLSLCEIVGHSPLWLNAFLTRCLATKPEDRFAQAGEALRELERCQGQGS